MKPEALFRLVVLGGAVLAGAQACGPTGSSSTDTVPGPQPTSGTGGAKATDGGADPGTGGGGGVQGW